MKIGSICECIRHQIGDDNVADCVPGEILTVCWAGRKYGAVFVGFEEKPQDDCYRADHFREIEFPPELEEQINQSLHQTVEI